ncbi:MAG: DUF3662 domain-containing protein [Acidimicrobiia bacterium]|nr:DUF3662 domain-containing protein [Acidimicrobiia bacterium]
MKLARELERRLERLVDGISATVFRGKMHPVDFANRLLRAVDLGAVDGPLGPQIDNALEVRVNPTELDADLDMHALELELAAAVTALAAQRGIRTGGGVTVSVRMDDTVRVGSIRLDSAPTAVAMVSWAQLISPTGRHVLDIHDNRELIGRGEDADIVISHAEVSRHHALVFRTEGRVFLADLGSVNGTTVNGVALGTNPITIAPGDRLTFGPTTFTFRIT